LKPLQKKNYNTMKIKFILHLLALLMTIGISNGQNREKRNVSGFTMITFRLPGTLIIRQGKERSVEIEAPPGVLPKIDTRVTMGRLMIEPAVVDTKHFHEDFDYIKVYVTTIQLEDLHMYGSGKAIAEGNLDIEKINITLAGAGMASMEMKADSVLTNITGSGHLTLSGKIFYSHNNISGSGKTDIDAKIDGILHADISGSGEMNAKGSSDKVELVMAGSGKFNGLDFQTKVANISIAGSGHAEVSVSKSLETEIHGHGSISYKGNPEKVSSHGSSKATVTKVD